MKKWLAIMIAGVVLMSFAAFPFALADENDFVLISGGSFVMGSADDEPWRSADETQHDVTVGSFYMSPYEVTQAEYEAVMGVNPSTFLGSENPVEGVTV